MPLIRPALVLLLFLASSCSLVSGDLWPRSRIEIEIGGIPARVEVVRTKEERQQGLMHRTSLGKDEGMLFVFAEEKIQSFWMKNTLIPLMSPFSIRRAFSSTCSVWIPTTARIYSSSSPALYAIEMNAGWFAEKDLRRFARLKLPHPIVGE